MFTPLKRVRKYIGWMVMGLVISTFLILPVCADERPIKSRVTWSKVHFHDAESTNIKDLVGKGYNGYWWTTGLIVNLFQTMYPKVEVDIVNYIFGDELLTAIAGGTAADDYYIFSLQMREFIDKGLVADITEFVKRDWNKYFQYLPKSIWKYALKDGRYYGIPVAGIDVKIVLYRQDWFKEAGIFNKEGIAAPPDNWTMNDFTEIAKKLTNAKKKRWGFALPGGEGAGADLISWFGQFGVPILKPDPTQKFTWRAAFNSPESLKVLEWYRDVIHKDKSARYGVGIKGGMSGLVDGLFIGAQEIGMTMSTWPVVTSREARLKFGGPILLGAVSPTPLGLGDLYGGDYNVRPVGYMGVSSTIPRDRQEAAYNWDVFTNLGEGRVYWNMIKWGLGKQYKGTYAFFRAAHMTVPGCMREDVPEDAANVLDELYAKPERPEPEEFNLTVYGSNQRRMETELASLVQAIMEDPNVDVAAKANSLASLVDKVALNFKVKGTGVKNIKDYYTALANFYKENYPQYYKDHFEKMFEKYYKIW